MVPSGRPEILLAEVEEAINQRYVNEFDESQLKQPTKPQKQPLIMIDPTTTFVHVIFNIAQWLIHGHN